MSFAMTAFARVLASALPICRRPLPQHPLATAQQAPEAETLPPTAPPNPNTLRVGGFSIGQGDCPELYGHPDIRY
jgi:hypothetical protein